MRPSATRLVVAVAVLASGCVPLRIQDTPGVRGVVADAATNQPVKGARVYFQGFSSRAVVTGADGAFTLPPISRWHGVPLVGVMDRFDRMRMLVEASGYETAGLEYGHSGEIDGLRIALKPQ